MDKKRNASTKRLRWNLFRVRHSKILEKDGGVQRQSYTLGDQKYILPPIKKLRPSKDGKWGYLDKWPANASTQMGSSATCSLTPTRGWSSRRTTKRHARYDHKTPIPRETRSLSKERVTQARCYRSETQ
ncbi:uncharacterized protein LOC121387958 [Gigantopelta aegis]|uniref:uncharacterized protein LOC121387958 n=1 Tax=Gigantopelta aegis TaxID=1735272 RepID=UPI001B888E32|nr:uncharacterized protein LOC121387958 [Gigantopelta aegis]